MITWMALTPLHGAVGHLYMVYVLYPRRRLAQGLQLHLYSHQLFVLLWGCGAEFPLLQGFTHSWPWLRQHLGLSFCSSPSLRTNPCWNHLLRLFLRTVPSYSLLSSKGLLTCRSTEIMKSTDSTAAVKSVPQGSQPEQKLFSVLFCFDQFVSLHHIPLYQVIWSMGNFE